MAEGEIVSENRSMARWTAEALAQFSGNQRRPVAAASLQLCSIRTRGVRAFFGATWWEVVGRDLCGGGSVILNGGGEGNERRQGQLVDLFETLLIL